MKILIGITGASGAIYARQLAERLLSLSVELGLIFSRNGRAVAEHELIDNGQLTIDNWLAQAKNCQLSTVNCQLFENDDLFASPASGSAGWDAMVVVPCSMGTAARIATGVSDSLLTRAADVMLKERRRLIIVPREMPMSTLHLRNLLTLSELGAVVIPAAPAFYSLPQSIDDLCLSVVERIIAHLGIDAPHYEWGS